MKWQRISKERNTIRMKEMNKDINKCNGSDISGMQLNKAQILIIQANR